MAKQQMTIEDLAKKIDGVEDRLTKKIEVEVGGLAAMTGREFVRVQSKIDDAQKENKKHFEVIESAQVDLKLRQDNVAYRFELNDLSTRVTKLEKAR